MFRRAIDHIVIRGVYLKVSKFKFLTNATQHSMEIILQDKEQLRRSSNLVSNGQHCLEIDLNG